VSTTSKTSDCPESNGCKADKPGAEVHFKERNVSRRACSRPLCDLCWGPHGHSKGVAELMVPDQLEQLWLAAFV